MAHMAPKLLNTANMAQHGSLWLIGVYATHYGSIRLYVAQIATVGSIRLQMALMAPNLSNMALYGS